MRRKDKLLKVRGSAGHRGFNSICKIKRVRKADIASLLICSQVYVNKIFHDPHLLNVRQLTIIAGALGITPEFLVYIIRFNDHKTIYPPEVTTELEELKVKFPV